MGCSAQQLAAEDHTAGATGLLRMALGWRDAHLHGRESIQQLWRILPHPGGQVFTTHLFGEPAVSLGAPDGNKFLFSNENKLVQSSWPSTVQKLLGKHSVTIQVGKEHRVLRRIFTTLFNPEGLASFVPRIDAIARDHITKYWDGKESIQGVPTVKEFTFAVAADLFVSLADHDARFRPLEAALKDLLAGLFQLPIDLPGTAYHKGWLAWRSGFRIIQTLIAERKQELAEGTTSSRKDLLAILLTAPSEDGVGMADEVIQDNVITMLVAGHDSTSITLAVVLKYLHLNPSKLIQVQVGDGESARAHQHRPHPDLQARPAVEHLERRPEARQLRLGL